MSDDGYAVEQWVYAGVRANPKGQRRDVWIDPDGRKLWYADKGSFVIGGIYDAEVKRDGGQVVRRDPKWTGEKIEDNAQRLEYAALHAAGKSELVRISSHSKAARKDELAEAVDPLVELASKIRTGPERDALIAYVIRRMSAAW